MAIRFTCPGCSQPIEVDDNLALRPVACFYCRRTVTVPHESTLPEPSNIPVARASESGMTIATPPPSAVEYGYGRIPQTGRHSHLGLVAIVLISLSALMVIGNVLVIRANRTEYRKMTEILQKEGFSGFLEAQAELVEKNGGQLPSWMMLSSGLTFSSFACWLAGMICALVGMRGVYGHREKAAGALIGGGIVLIFICCGGGFVAT